MNRDKRTKLAAETVAICNTGSYFARSGNRVDVAPEIKSATDGTRMYSLETVAQSGLSQVTTKAVITATNETTFQALQRLNRLGGHIGCLNFASAKNPGGGFLNGSQAQEEALARSSALYPCLLKAPEYYERNRANHSTIYLDLVIYSPLVPFFRNDDGDLLEQPVLASVITAPAPNAGAVMQNEPRNTDKIVPALRRRAELVLCIARLHKIENLVLGAWGCGVFRNDPAMVAGILADLLNDPGRFKNAFNKVIFAVYDRTDEQQTFKAFRAVFG
jgi:uncharacterized protein (TIGR02452 family)